MVEETEIFITPKQAQLLHSFFNRPPFYADLDKSGLTFGWKDSKTSIEWPIMSYKNKELKINLDRIKGLPKKIREDVVKIMAESKILEILEDLDVKI